MLAINLCIATKSNYDEELASHNLLKKVRRARMTSGSEDAGRKRRRARMTIVSQDAGQERVVAMKPNQSKYD